MKGEWTMSDSRDQFKPFEFNWNDVVNRVTKHQDFSWLDKFVEGTISKALPNHQFPFNMAKGGLKSLDKYMDQIFSQAMPNANGQPLFNSGQDSVKSEVFETHHWMFVRIKVPNRAIASKLRISLGVNQVRVSGLTKEIETIGLPATARLEGARAIYKDGILEIRIPKDLNEQFHEVNIQFL
jgi:HSP20 family molecular chaperone IbpA